MSTEPRYMEAYKEFHLVEFQSKCYAFSNYLGDQNIPELSQETIARWVEKGLCAVAATPYELRSKVDAILPLHKRNVAHLLPPGYLEEYKEFHLVEFQSKCYAFSNYLGEFHIPDISPEMIDGWVETGLCAVASSLDELRIKVDNIFVRRDESGSLKAPLYYEIEPSRSCNLRCKMCTSSFNYGVGNPDQEYLDIELLKGMEEALRGKWISIGVSHEPTMNLKKFVAMVRYLSSIDCKLVLLTNGTLLTKEATDQMVGCNFKMVAFSIDSVVKETYEKIRIGAKFDKVIERVLYFRERFSASDTVFLVRAVLMRSNIDELIGMLDFWNRYNFHSLKLVPLTIGTADELSDEDIYPIHEHALNRIDTAISHLLGHKMQILLDVPLLANSKIAGKYQSHSDSFGVVKSEGNHGVSIFPPSYYYQIGPYPTMPIDCRSPYVACYIDNKGDVLLCRQYRIGGLKDFDFGSLWNGPEAERVRRTIIKNPARSCGQCDLYNCITERNQDLGDRNSAFVGDAALLKNLRSESLAKPELIEWELSDFFAVNIVAYYGIYYGISRALGDLVLENVAHEAFVELEEKKLCVRGEDLADVKKRIQLLANKPMMVESNYHGFNIVQYLYNRKPYHGLSLDLGDLQLGELSGAQIDGWVQQGRWVMAGTLDEAKAGIDLLLNLPILVERNYKGFNIVRYRRTQNDYQCVSMELGALNLIEMTDRQIVGWKKNGLWLMGRSLDEVKTRIDVLMAPVTTTNSPISGCVKFLRSGWRKMLNGYSKSVTLARRLVASLRR